MLKERHLKLSSQRTKEKKVKEVKDLWHILKQINIHTMVVPKGEERENKGEALFKEIMAPNFLYLGWEMDIQIPK